MATVLVTGPIGSGKSLVCRYLASKGYKVYYCDDAVKELYRNTPGLITKIEKELGIGFKELKRIFEDDNLRLKLEAIVFPLLIEDILKWKSENSGLVFIESATALGLKDFDSLYDKVLLVNAPYTIRLNRNSATAQRDRLQSFDPSRIDFMVENTGTKNDLYNKIDNILWQLI